MNKRRKFTALLGILICVVLLMSCKKNDTGEETYEPVSYTHLIQRRDR